MQAYRDAFAAGNARLVLTPDNDYLRLLQAGPPGGNLEPPLARAGAAREREHPRRRDDEIEQPRPDRQDRNPPMRRIPRPPARLHAARLAAGRTA